MIVPAKKGPPLTLLFDTVTLKVVLLGTSASIATLKRSTLPCAGTPALPEAPIAAPEAVGCSAILFSQSAGAPAAAEKTRTSASRLLVAVVGAHGDRFLRLTAGLPLCSECPRLLLSLT